MVRSLLLVIAILITSSFEVTPSYAQGCGYHTVYGQVLCRDYKGRSVSTSHCNQYTSEIGPRPPVPRRQCPNPCCTETHTVDGVVVDSEVKVAGSCNSTSRTTTCEERGDCPPPPPTCTNGSNTESRNREQSCPSGQTGSITIQEERAVITRADCTTSSGTWTEVSRNNNCTPTGSSCPSSSNTESRTRDQSCPSGQTGTISISEQRTVTTNTDCTTSSTSWSEVSRNNTCQSTCTASSIKIDGKMESNNCPAGQTGALNIWYEKYENTNTNCQKSTTGWIEVGRHNTCQSTCTYSRKPVDSKNEVTNCPSGQKGQISRWYEKFEITQTDCSKSVSGWELVQTDGSCKTCSLVRGTATTTVSYSSSSCEARYNSHNPTGNCGSGGSQQTSEEDFKVTTVKNWVHENCGAASTPQYCSRTETTTYSKVEQCK